jgi:hypothetical protein
MNNNIGLQAEALRKDLIELLNQSGLPVCLAYYVFKDVYGDLKQTYQQTLDAERQDQSADNAWTWSSDDPSDAAQSTDNQGE